MQGLRPSCSCSSGETDAAGGFQADSMCLSRSGKHDAHSMAICNFQVLNALGSAVAGADCACMRGGSRAPLWLISSQTSGLVRILSSASAICLELVGSTSRPWCSVAMMSTGPPFLVATVGTPCAAACAANNRTLL